MHCHVTGGRQTDLGGKVKHHCGVWSFGIHDVHVSVMIGQSIDNRSSRLDFLSLHLSTFDWFWRPETH